MFFSFWTGTAEGAGLAHGPLRPRGRSANATQARDRVRGLGHFAGDQRDGFQGRSAGSVVLLAKGLRDVLHGRIGLRIKYS